MIRNIKLKWGSKGTHFTPPSKGLTGEYFDPPFGLAITAKPNDIFSDPPVLQIEVKKETGHVVTDDIYLFVSYEYAQEITIPSGPPPMKLVGDPARGALRRVYEFIGKESGADLRLGLTIHEAFGTWSSEPHSFELEALKSLKPMRFWEEFAYITQPANEWGIQMRQGFLNGQLIQDIQPIRDRDILDIPLGVHMVTAAPGVKLAYIWVYQAEDISAAEKF